LDAAVEIAKTAKAEDEAALRDSIRPDFKAFREFIEERGWDWDDDWSVWTLTEMIEAASCFLLYAKDDDGVQTPAGEKMQAVMAAVTELLASIVAGSEDIDGDRGARSRSLDVERRRLALLDHELAVDYSAL
jgi:hypothetical protein